MGEQGTWGLGLLSTQPVRFTYLIKLVLQTLEQIRLGEKRRCSVPPHQRLARPIQSPLSASGLEGNFVPKIPAPWKVLI